MDFDQILAGGLIWGGGGFLPPDPLKIRLPLLSRRRVKIGHTCVLTPHVGEVWDGLCSGPAGIPQIACRPYSAVAPLQLAGLTWGTALDPGWRYPMTPFGFSQALALVWLVLRSLKKDRFSLVHFFYNLRLLVEPH